MSDGKRGRLSTGEEGREKRGENEEGERVNKPFVIIPQQTGQGQPVQLMMSSYSP